MEGSKTNQMPNSEDTTDSRSNQDVTSGNSACPFGDWIEIELLGDEDAPIRDEACIITDSRGTEYKGKTDSMGIIRLEGVAQGECTVSFVELDEGAWGAELENKSNKG